VRGAESPGATKPTPTTDPAASAPELARRRDEEARQQAERRQVEAQRSAEKQRERRELVAQRISELLRKVDAPDTEMIKTLGKILAGGYYPSYGAHGDREQSESDLDKGDAASKEALNNILGGLREMISTMDELDALVAESPPTPDVSGYLAERDGFRKMYSGFLVQWACSAQGERTMGLREMRLRYDDLRRIGRSTVCLPAVVEPTDYYNCRYRSQARWRGFAVADRDGASLHAYCRKGVPFCDALFERGIAAPQTGVAVLSYPEANNVCEEDQAQLVGWNDDQEAMRIINASASGP
jgi:hypothetical protein